MTVEPAGPRASTSHSDKVRDLMTRAVARIAPDATLAEVSTKLMAVEAGALAVGTVDSVTGVVSERDVVRAIGLGRDPETATAGDVASHTLIWCAPGDSALDAATTMDTRGVRHLLVGDADENELVGIVSARDLIRALVRTQPGAVRAED